MVKSSVKNYLKKVKLGDFSDARLQQTLPVLFHCSQYCVHAEVCCQPVCHKRIQLHFHNIYFWNTCTWVICRQILYKKYNTQTYLVYFVISDAVEVKSLGEPWPCLCCYCLIVKCLGQNISLALTLFQKSQTRSPCKVIMMSSHTGMSVARQNIF